MAYTYTNGDGLSALDASEPNGATEPVSNLDDSIRQIKAYLKDPTGGLQKVINDVSSLQTQLGTANNRASFVAYLSTPQTANQSSGVELIEFDQETLDPDGCFNTSTSKFTAPAAGLYLFILSVRLDATSASDPVNITHRLSFYKNGSVVTTSENEAESNTAGRTYETTRMIQLAQGDTVDARYEVVTVSGTITMSVTADPIKTVFQGFRVA